jgi:hypothetical protein
VNPSNTQEVLPSLSLPSAAFSLVEAESRTTSCKASKAIFFYSPPSLSIFLSACSLVCNNRAPDITMSFGFSVGDFVAVLQLANDIRKQFVDAPSQFKAISKE